MHVREKAIRLYLQTCSFRIAAAAAGTTKSSIERWIHDPRMQPIVDRLNRDVMHLANTSAHALLRLAQSVLVDRLQSQPELISARDAAVVYGIAMDKVEQTNKAVQDLPQSDHLDYFDPDKLDELRAQVWEGLTEQRRRLLLDKQVRAVESHTARLSAPQDAQLVPDPVQADAVPAQTSPAIIPPTLTSNNAVSAESSPYSGLPEPDQD